MKYHFESQCEFKIVEMVLMDPHLSHCIFLSVKLEKVTPSTITPLNKRPMGNITHPSHLAHI
jgi:hypothetical protein